MAASDTGSGARAGTGRLSAECIVGVLALQGDFEAHERLIERLGHRSVRVRRAVQLPDLDALVLPGGESTTMLLFLEREGLMQPLRDFCASGRPVLGTCAGAILLARTVEGPRQDSLGVLDITIRRNAYGRQLQSFVGHADTPLHPDLAGSDAALELVCIRAPLIERLGPDVEVLVSADGRPMAVRQGALVASTFHPEMSGDTRLLACVLSGGATGNAAGKVAATPTHAATLTAPSASTSAAPSERTS